MSVYVNMNVCEFVFVCLCKTNMFAAGRLTLNLQGCHTCFSAKLSYKSRFNRNTYKHMQVCMYVNAHIVYLSLCMHIA